MSYRITTEYVWVGTIPDRVGALAEQLKALSEGGLDLELILGWRDRPGRGLMSISPLRTLEEIDVAEKAGLSKSDSLRTLRIEGPNVVGLGAKISGALAEAGIAIRGYWAVALGEQTVTSIAFDSDEDAKRAKEILERVLGS